MWAIPVALAGLLLVPILPIVLGPTASRAIRSTFRGTFARPMSTIQRLGKRAQVVSRQPGVAALSGITVLLVPTLFAIFPGWGTGWKVGPKLGLLLLWVVAGTIIVARTIRMEKQIEEGAPGPAERGLRFDVTARMRTLSTLLTALFALPATQLPTGYQPQVFYPNEWRTHLLPWWDPHAIGPVEGWRIDRDPPEAVTGAAWVTNDYVFAKGAALPNAAFGLTRAQQARYRRLTGVSAMPIRDPSGMPFAVLTVCTEDPEPRVAEREFVEQQIALAAYLAPLLTGVGHLGRRD